MSMHDSKRKAGTEAGPPTKKIKSEHGNNSVHPDRRPFQKGDKPNGFKQEVGKEGVLNGSAHSDFHLQQGQLTDESQVNHPAKPITSRNSSSKSDKPPNPMPILSTAARRSGSG